MTENQPIDLLTLSQAIVDAHQKSDVRQEELLRAIRDQPARWLDTAHFESRHRELERRVTVLEDGLRDLPERILEKMEERFKQVEERFKQAERRAESNRGRWLTIALQVIGWLILIGLTVGSYLHK